MIINITQENCMLCGKPVDDINERIKGHLIPKCLNPVDNVIVLLHKKCENKINELYIAQ